MAREHRGRVGRHRRRAPALRTRMHQLRLLVLRPARWGRLPAEYIHPHVSPMGRRRGYACFLAEPTHRTRRADEPTPLPDVPALRVDGSVPSADDPAMRAGSSARVSLAFRVARSCTTHRREFWRRAHGVPCDSRTIARLQKRGLPPKRKVRVGAGASRNRRRPCPAGKGG